MPQDESAGTAGVDGGGTVTHDAPAIAKPSKPEIGTVIIRAAADRPGYPFVP